MDLAYYRNFLTIIEAGSLSAAARKLHLAQPALSAQLKTLEQNYGTKLIKLQRGVRKLELTDAGNIFHEKAKYLCALEESTRWEMQNLAEGIAGTLKISLSPARAPLFVKKYIKPFCKMHPQVRYQIHEVDVHTQVSHILSGITDLAITNAPLPDPQRFKILLAQKDNFIVAWHKKSGFYHTGGNKIKLKDLAGQPLCTNFGSYPLLKAAFAKTQATPDFVSVSTTRTTALQFARQNLGIAVIPAEKGEDFGKNLRAAHLSEKNLFLSKTVFIAKDKKLSPTVNKFLQFYQQQEKDE